MVVAVAGLLLSFIAGAEAAECSSTTVVLDVASTDDLQDFIDAVNCTGEGEFNVTWYGNLQVGEVIDISDQKRLTVTGSDSSVAGIDDDTDAVAVIDAGGTNGLFSLSEGSTLILNNLVLTRGDSDSGGAISASSSSAVRVVDCVFSNNTASTGGERTRNHAIYRLCTIPLVVP